MTPPRVRFAPSPTGFLHVGGARTALFNWLFARRHAGTFVLRIEDTDRTRSNPRMTEAILNGMTWMGLDWDEGPIFQLDGEARHREDALALLAAGSAYRCFCSPELLETRRAELATAGSERGYDQHCRNVTPDESAARAAAGESFALRFRVPTGETSWDDAVYGPIRFNNADIEDFVILRSDGTPVYNMAVVSDDIEMAITQVIRGEDHISNTPKQILLYRALGAPLPVFAHVPMILGPDGKRLSKRHGATAVEEYQSQGILPDALVNFLALLGWSPGNDDEILSRDEMVARFSLDAINKKSAVFDVQKLEWMNGRYMAVTPAAELAPLVAARMVAHGIIDDSFLASHQDWLSRLIDLLRTRARTVDELALQTQPYLSESVHYDGDAVAQHWKDVGAVRERLERIRTRIAPLDRWEPEALEVEIRGVATDLGVGAGKVIHPLRVALTGVDKSPGIFEVAAILGRDVVLHRIDAALRSLGNGS